MKWLLSLSITSSMFISVIAYDRISSFFMANNPLYAYTAFSLSTYLSMNICGVCTSWLLWIVLQWTWECKYLFKILNSVFLDMSSEVGWLDHTEVLFFLFGHSALHVESSFPDQGSNPCHLQWKCRILTTGPPSSIFNFIKISMLFSIVAVSFHVASNSE